MDQEYDHQKELASRLDTDNTGKRINKLIKNKGLNQPYKSVKM